MSDELSNIEINATITYFGTKTQKNFYGGCIAANDMPGFDPKIAEFYIVSLGSRESGGFGVFV